MTDTPQHCSFIALAGAPNTGKSTLINRIVGNKVAIVSPKVQTTRSVLRGISVHDNTQLILIDTPGVFTPKRTLEKAIVHNAWQGIKEANQVLLLVNAKKGLCRDTEALIERFKKMQQRCILVINKIDAVKPDILLPLTERLNSYGIFTDTFMISALNGNGVDDLIKQLTSTAPKGPWMFPEDQLSDAPMKLFAAEITREKLFMHLQNELPYSLMVETEKWEETKKGELKIYQNIYTNKPNHKMIILGKHGSLIKKIGQKSREELCHLLGQKVHLFLFVKVRENWTSNPHAYTEMGMESPSS